jgi:hypothetical protein
LTYPTSPYRPRVTEEQSYVVESIFRPTAHLRIRSQPLQRRHNGVLIKSAVDSRYVSKTGGRKAAHVRALMAQEFKASILHPTPVGIVKGNAN